MHIPDGFLSPPVWAALDVAAAPAVGFAIRRARQGVTEGQAPLLGVMGAFVFAAQMMNFPVGLGTSGHLLGGALLAVTLGPAAASVVLTAILILQSLVFQDGGLLALGANVFNMAVVGVWAAWIPYRYLSHGRWRRCSIFFAGFLSVIASAACALAELRLSGVAMNGAVVGVSTLLFTVTACLEGLITVTVAYSIGKLNPEWLSVPAGPPRQVVGLIASAALLIALVGVLFASALPDGLEALAEKVGIASTSSSIVASPMADYEVNFVNGEWLRKGLAGLTGVALIYLLCFVLGRILVRQRSV